MGSISLFFFLISLQGFSHSGLTILSLSLFIVNVLGYILLSGLILKKKSVRAVVRSVVFFLAIGLFIWIVYITSGQLGNLFFIYHIAGYSSFIWYDSLSASSNESFLVEMGLFYSIIPSVLIVVGYYVRRLLKSKQAFHRISLYVGSIIVSFLLVILSSAEGKRIETKEELANAFPMKSGFPLQFAELNHPTIDPPLPYTYGGFDCCTVSIVSWAKFSISVGIMAFALILIGEVIFLLYKKISRLA